MFNVRTTFGKMANAFSVHMSWFRKVGAYLIHFTIEVKGGEEKGITAFVRKPDNPSEQDPPTIVLDVTGLHIGSGGAELGGATPLVDSGTGAVGTSTKASREDHAHPLNAEAANTIGTIGNYPTLPPWQTGNTGSSEKYARSDHQHPLQTSMPGLLGDAPPLPDSHGRVPYYPEVGFPGTSSMASREDHVHETSAPMIYYGGPERDDSWPQKDGGNGHPGNSPLYSRANHIHPRSATYLWPNQEISIPYPDSVNGSAGYTNPLLPYGAHANHSHPFAGEVVAAINNAAAFAAFYGGWVGTYLPVLQNASQLAILNANDITTLQNNIRILDGNINAVNSAMATNFATVNSNLATLNYMYGAWRGGWFG